MSFSTPDELQKQLIADLLIESFEGLERFDRELLTLEKGARDPEPLNVIFRVIHTIKGTAGCLGLGKIEATAHVGESLLSLLRDGMITVSAEMITTLLALSDALRGILREVEATGQEGNTDHSVLLAQLQNLQKPTALTPAEPAGNLNGFGLFDDVISDGPATVPAPAPAPVLATNEAETPVSRSSITDTAIRVDVTQLDKLMNLVGELVLARNQIIQNVVHPDPAALLAASQRLNLITTELQGSVMKTRMQPIGNTWTKFPRIVRDLSHELGKKIVLVMEGQDTELDRTIIEAIKDPLTHIVRNAIDHGLEVPSVRLASGKTEEGRLSLRAFHEGGQVNIEFSDDGQGINVARVKAKAIERELITNEQASRLSDREVFNLIFLPGFSTAEKISNLSGRGVGMDVVKTNIEKIGGSVDIHSVAEKGTTLKIKIPLTLAIVPALIVKTAGERFAIPQVSLQELVRLEPTSTNPGIEYLFDAPVYRRRGQLLPLVFLHRELQLGEPKPGQAINIVVLKADQNHFGLIVDEVLDTEEIVVKPLGKHLKGIGLFAGATIMGDGRTALILDALGLAQHAHVVTQRHEVTAGEDPTAAHVTGRQQSLLLFDLGAWNHMAMPLSCVGRLEKFPARIVEREGSREVVQYRGEIMPLIRLHTLFAIQEEETMGEELPVVVHSLPTGNVGLIIGKIDDIIDASYTLRDRVHRPGILGSAVIKDRVTEIIDVDRIVQMAATH